MDGVRDILESLDLVELVIIRVAVVLGILLFCVLLVRNQLKEFSKGKARRGRVRSKETKAK